MLIECSWELIDFYAPMVERVIAAADQQIRRAKRGLPDDRRIAVSLVGTLSQSPYLKAALQNWLQT